jgi:hypothetical protein
VGMVAGIDGDLRFALTETIEADVSGDAIKPAADRQRIAESILSAKGTEKCFLGKVLGFRGVSHEMENVAIDS